MIRTLVAQNRIKEALDALMLTKQTEGIQLSARFNSIEREKNMGLLSNADYTMFKNQIVNAILSYSGESSVSNTVFPPKTENTSLLSIVTESKRRRPKVANEAQAILNEYQKYNDTKTTTPSFDPAGRRYRAIQEKEAKFLADYREAKELSLEVTVERVMEYLKESIPDYNDLAEAYKLASGRGMTDGWIVDQLNNRPNDNETRITIAERIENFISRI